MPNDGDKECEDEWRPFLPCPASDCWQISASRRNSSWRLASRQQRGWGVDSTAVSIFVDIFVDLTNTNTVFVDLTNVSTNIEAAAEKLRDKLGPFQGYDSVEQKSRVKVIT